MGQDDLIDTVQAGAALGVTAQRVRMLIKAGRLPAQQVGTTYVIRRADLAKVRVRKPGRPKGKK